ncbi:hypothetical protein C8034_v004772 [Colletotrichum sidae]|uniref:Uncharacterized protein n=1 Tax=Colletotrichum sidae TaxID=1347389 RepID=A0A4R8T715_9PEZI|nr:hypothetical protein C8034_v004772 [Colletotrichum sidae]
MSSSTQANPTWRVPNHQEKYPGAGLPAKSNQHLVSNENSDDITQPSAVEFLSLEYKRWCREREAEKARLAEMLFFTPVIDDEAEARERQSLEQYYRLKIQCLASNLRLARKRNAAELHKTKPELKRLRRDGPKPNLDRAKIYPKKGGMSNGLPKRCRMYGRPQPLVLWEDEGTAETDGTASPGNEAVSRLTDSFRGLATL